MIYRGQPVAETALRSQRRAAATKNFRSPLVKPHFARKRAYRAEIKRPPLALKATCEPSRLESAAGTFLPCQPRRAMSVIEGIPADICSLRGFRIFDPQATLAGCS